MFIPQYVSVQECVALIQSGMRVFSHGGACTPIPFFAELAKQSHRLRDVEVVSITLMGAIEIDRPEFASSFHMNSFFVSEPVRDAVNEGRADFIPIFLSDIPDLFKSNRMPIDVAMVQVSPPDAHGYCSLGLSVDIARTAVNTARSIIALVNPEMPRTLGDSQIHFSRFSCAALLDFPLPEINYGNKATAEELKIGERISELIEDRSTIQMGIGTIPDATLRCLFNHKDLGVHTEMCSDGIMALMLKDVITNRYKNIHMNKVVTSFATGSRGFYDFLNDHSAFAFLDIDYVNDPHVISRIDRMVAINSALEIDLTGQVCADSVGTYQYSGIGGQMDFMRGAALSKGGKPIIALTSRTKRGLPRIVPVLKPGAGVVTTRGHVHYVVTEYGVVNLIGKNLRERSRLLTSIAHPDDREMLAREFQARFKARE